jgi:hypothetical protein
MFSMSKLLSLVAGWLLLTVTVFAVDIERAPINYTKSEPQDLIARLQKQLDNGKAALSYDKQFGYLPALLKELQVPTSSQVLVYSKTSFQRNRIAPYRPRAIYFNDRVYVGYCQGGDVLEISVADPQHGTNFYSLEQLASEKPKLIRQTENCLICHGSSRLEGLPGHLLRSVYSDASGMPMLALGSSHVDQTTDFKKHWGGWYVTGEHGTNQHLGNLIVRGRIESEKEIDPSVGQNVTKLDKYFDTDQYLTPHSDIVSLLVLEHQTGMHNLLARCSINTRAALHDEVQLNRDLNKPETHRWGSTTSRINDAVEPLLRYALMSEAVTWQGKIRGTSGFAEEFAKAGPTDSRNRSLRELSLDSRLFRYPCSFLLYSPEFQELPREAQELFFKKLRAVVRGENTDPAYAHLTPTDRQAIGEIVYDTLPASRVWLME